MDILAPVAAQVVTMGTPAPGYLDPLFITAVAGSLAFIWMMLRFIFDDVDLHGTDEDFGSHLPAGSAAHRHRPSEEEREGRRKVRRLPSTTATVTPIGEPVGTRVVSSTDPPPVPHHPHHRDRPAA